MLSFDDFEALIPKDIDFRPNLAPVIRRYGRNHREAREHFRGPDGYVLKKALLLVQDSRRPPRALSDQSDLALTEPEKHFAKKVADLAHPTPNKRGSKRKAAAIFYWFFRAVDEPTYFGEIARNTWPNTSETFKRLIFAKFGGNKEESYSKISERFRSSIDIVEEGFQKNWFGRQPYSLNELVQKANLEPDAKTKTIDMSPHLGLKFFQAGMQVDLYLHSFNRGKNNEGQEHTTLVPLRYGDFSVSRPRSLTQLEEIPNLMFSMQTHAKVHRAIEKEWALYNVPNSEQIFQGVKISIGDGMADFEHGSSTYYFDDNVAVRNTISGDESSVRYIDLVWNIVTKNRFHFADATSYGVNVKNIENRLTEEDFSSLTDVLYVTFLDFYNDELLDGPNSLDLFDRTMFNYLRLEKVVLLFY